MANALENRTALELSLYMALRVLVNLGPRPMLVRMFQMLRRLPLSNAAVRIQTVRFFAVDPTLELSSANGRSAGLPAGQSPLHQKRGLNWSRVFARGAAHASSAAPNLTH